jgi:hypothetical protein
VKKNSVLKCDQNAVNMIYFRTPPAEDGGRGPMLAFSGDIGG